MFVRVCLGVYLPRRILNKREEMGAGCLRGVLSEVMILRQKVVR